MDIDQGQPEGVIVTGSDGKSYRFPPGVDEATAKTRIEARLSGGGSRVTDAAEAQRRIARPTFQEVIEEGVTRGARPFDPTGGVIARSAGNIVAHPIDNAPALGAMAATALTGGTALVPIMIAAGLGGAGGSGVRSIYNQTVEGQPETPDDVVGNMTGEGALNALFAGLAFKAPGAFRSTGNAAGRAAAKIPASISERVPGFRNLGQTGARKALVNKAFDKGLVPGSADAAFAVRKGPGGIDELNANMQAVLDAADQAGTRINAGTEVAPVFGEVRPGYAGNPSTAGERGVRAVDAERRAFRNSPVMARPSKLGPWRVYRDDVKPSALNEAKVRINRGIAEGSWAEQSAPATQMQKALSGRMASTVRARVPGAAATLDDEAMMLPLEEALQLASARAGNRDILSLKGFAAPTSAKSLLGFLDRPAVSGYTGYGLDRLGRMMGEAPPNVRLAILQALRSRLPSLQTER